MSVPLLDLHAQFAALREDVMEALGAVIERQHFIMGEEVARLEQAIAQLSHAGHGVACASGTDALLLSLTALDLRTGDEVITSPFTFFATAGAIHNAGGTPVFVDIEPDTYNLDPTLLEAAVTPRTPFEKSYSGRIVSRSWSARRLGRSFFIVMALASGGESGANDSGPWWPLHESYYKQPVLGGCTHHQVPFLAY